MKERPANVVAPDGSVPVAETTLPVSKEDTEENWTLERKRVVEGKSEELGGRRVN